MIDIEKTTKPILIMLVGLPASGKSTYAKRTSGILNLTVHSSDEIRKEFLNDIKDQSQNQLVFDTLHKRVIKDLQQGKNVILDATNLNMKRRKAFLDSLSTKKNCINCYKAVKVFATPYNECINRDRKREDKVGGNVIERMYKNFQMPSYGEGWDKIEIEFDKLLLNEEYMKHNYNIEDLFKILDNIEQHNENHTLTIGKHCEKVSDLLLYDKVEIFIAGLLHDIGKKFTMQFKDYNNKSTKQAHYYGHESVSAYESIFYLKTYGYTDEKIIYIINLIQYHMMPYFLKTEKSINRFVEKVGEKMWKDILILNEADKKAK